MKSSKTNTSDLINLESFSNEQIKVKTMANDHLAIPGNNNQNSQSRLSSSDSTNSNINLKTTFSNSFWGNAGRPHNQTGFDLLNYNLKQHPNSVKELADFFSILSNQQKSFATNLRKLFLN